MGNVQVATVEERYFSPVYAGLPISFGAVGQAVKLHAVHYSFDFFVASASLYVTCALSTNPQHELNPPGDQDLFYQDEALYGFASLLYGQSRDGINWGLSASIPATIVIPLYGIIRPRRQVLVFYFLHSGQYIRIRTEVYYEPITLDRVSLDALDRKYGKYRRT